MWIEAGGGREAGQVAAAPPSVRGAPRYGSHSAASVAEAAAANQEAEINQLTQIQERLDIWAVFLLH